MRSTISRRRSKVDRSIGRVNRDLWRLRRGGRTKRASVSPIITRPGSSWRRASRPIAARVRIHSGGDKETGAKSERPGGARRRARNAREGFKRKESRRRRRLRLFSSLDARRTRLSYGEGRGRRDSTNRPLSSRRQTPALHGLHGLHETLLNYRSPRESTPRWPVQIVRQIVRLFGGR